MKTGHYYYCLKHVLFSFACISGNEQALRIEAKLLPFSQQCEPSNLGDNLRKISF